MPRLRFLARLAALVLSDLRCAPVLGPTYWLYVRLRWLHRTGALRRPERVVRAVEGTELFVDDVERSVLTNADGIAHQRRIEHSAWRCGSITELRHLQWLNRCAIEDLVEQHHERVAEQRAMTLLLGNLTEAQRRQFAAFRYFDVIGGESRRRYRIWHRAQQNIEELDRFGNRRCVWCVHPIGVALGDVLLAQKTALELFEFEAIRIARCYSGFASEVVP